MKTTRNPPSSSLQSSEAELAFCGDIILTPPFFLLVIFFVLLSFLSFFLSSSSPPRKEREREELVSSNSSLFIKSGGTKKVTTIFTSDAPCFFSLVLTATKRVYVYMFLRKYRVRKIGGIVVVGPFLFSQTRSQGYAHTLSLFLSKEEQVEEEDDDDDNDVDDG